jgi:hypothetical protein
MRCKSALPTYSTTLVKGVEKAVAREPLATAPRRMS